MLVLVINLKESKERLSKISNVLHAFNIDFKRIDAIRGSAINRNDHPEIFKGSYSIVHNTFISKSKLVGNLTDGELGCSLSHLKAYDYVLQSKEPGAIILEDDFLPKVNLVDIFSKAVKVCPQADIITGNEKIRAGLKNAFWTLSRKIPDTDCMIRRVGIPGLDWFFNRRRRHGTTSCYYITAAACQKLLFLAYPVRFEADVLTGMVAMNGLKYFSIQPQLGYPCGESDIGIHCGTKFY